VVRLFGDGLPLVSGLAKDQSEVAQPLRAAAAAMAAEDRATLTGVSRKLQRHQAAAAAGPGTRLRLVPVGVSGANPTLAAEPNSLTQYHASRI
jgi:hypothetical protein